MSTLHKDTLAVSEKAISRQCAEVVRNISYYLGGQHVTPTGYCHPFKTFQGSITDYICSDGVMAQKSEDGIKTFYLTFRDKTDTLDLDIRRVPTTPNNG